MSKKVVVVLAQGFEEIEAVTVIDLLRRSDIEVTIAGINSLTIKGSHGIEIIAQKKFEELTEDFDACVLPGGMPGSVNLANCDKLKGFIIDLYQKNKVIAAICAAPALVLAPLGILNGKEATCYAGMQEELNTQIIYKEESVVIAGNIITSRCPATAIAFSLAIIEKLLDKDQVLTIKKALLLA